MALPTPPPAFARKKDVILRDLAVPDADYSDASPKGSVDAGIRDLIDEINSLPGFVTTSSCAGRVSVFAEGRKKRKLLEKGEPTTAEEQDDDGASREPADSSKTLAGIGGKGGGGNWLFVSHDPVPVPDSGWGEGEVERVLGLQRQDIPDNGPESTASQEQPGVAKKGDSSGEEDIRLIHFKFEPMILHVLTASLEHAQLLLRCALQAGFRESGAINLLPLAAAAVTTTGGSLSAEAPVVLPIVAVRSMGLAVESLVGELLDDDEGNNADHHPSVKTTVSPVYLSTLVRVANERFIENGRRIARFREAVESAAAAGGQKEKKKKTGDGANGEWEDAQARRERKRAEGLRKKAEKMEIEKQQNHDEGVEDLDMPLTAEIV